MLKAARSVCEPLLTDIRLIAAEPLLISSAAVVLFNEFALSPGAKYFASLF